MVDLGKVFKEGSTARQLLVWQVLAQVIGALAAPGFTELSKLSNNAAPVMPLPADMAAAAVARGFLTEDQGKGDAADTGYGWQVFDVMTRLATHAPDLSAAFELFRRGYIPEGTGKPEEASLTGALADAGIKPGWHSKLVTLAQTIPTQAEVLNAWLEGQIPESEARQRLLQAGMMPDWIDSAYNANGQPPTPVQALELANRGIIPWEGEGPHSVSYRQAFLEGPWRNKWEPVFRALGEYLPPPRTVTAMFHGGQIDHTLAAELLTKQGLRKELVTAYLSKSSHTAATTEHHLAKSEITTAYADGLMTKPQALTALRALRYTDHDAALILQLIDVKVRTAQLNQGVARVRTLFEAGKITESEAEHLATQLGLDAATARAIVQTWRLTLSVRTKTLSAAQIESAAYYQFIRTDDALRMLTNLGYDEFDAWLALAVRFKGTTGLPPRPESPFPAPKPTPKPIK